jgi:hypothetical protein
VSAAAVEVVDINQIKAIKAKRRRDIKRLDAAVGAVRQSTVETADAIAECDDDNAWEEDDDFNHARASGTIKVAADFNGWTLAAWVNFRYGFKATHATQLLRAGRVRLILKAGSNNAAALLLPENEHQYRPFSKAMATKWFKPLDEEEDIPARDEAIRRSWQAALKGNDGDVAAAAKTFPQFAKADEYEPMARMYADTTRTQAEKDAILAARIARFAKLGRLLLEQGRRGDVQRVFEELLG